jgi:hypothetical protein
MFENMPSEEGRCNLIHCFNEERIERNEIMTDIKKRKEADGKQRY